MMQRFQTLQTTTAGTLKMMAEVSCVRIKNTEAKKVIVQKNRFAQEVILRKAKETVGNKGITKTKIGSDIGIT